MQITLHDEHTIAVAFDFSRATVAWLKEQGGARWNPALRCWLVPLGHLRRICERFPAAQVADDAAAAVEAHEEWQAMNVVRPYIQDGSHRMQHNPETGCVWLEGPVVDEQPEWFARMLAPYVPALRRIIRRQMEAKAQSLKSVGSPEVEGAKTAQNGANQASLKSVNLEAGRGVTR